MTELVDHLLCWVKAKEQINRLEDNSDYVITRLEHLMFDHPDIPKEQLDIVSDFVAWCLAKDKEDINKPRGRDGKSYRERAKENQGASPDILFKLKERLAKLTVLGPWEEYRHRWIRPEAGTTNKDRVFVWKCEEDGGLEPGWYYRIGVGVLGIPGSRSLRPSATAEECMARVDELLASEKSIITA
jgi:hypothetical protein